MKPSIRDIGFLVVVLGGLAGLVGGLLRPSGRVAASPARSRPDAARTELGPIVARVDESFRKRWAEQELVPATPAPELTIMRRLALSLCGTIPSLEEVRRFE